MKDALIPFEPNWRDLHERFGGRWNGVLMIAELLYSSTDRIRARTFGRGTVRRKKMLVSVRSNNVRLE